MRTRDRLNPSAGFVAGVVFAGEPGDGDVEALGDCEGVACDSVFRCEHATSVSANAQPIARSRDGERREITTTFYPFLTPAARGTDGRARVAGRSHPAQVR